MSEPQDDTTTDLAMTIASLRRKLGPIQSGSTKEVLDGILNILAIMDAAITDLDGYSDPDGYVEDEEAE